MSSFWQSNYGKVFRVFAFVPVLLIGYAVTFILASLLFSIPGNWFGSQLLPSIAGGYLGAFLSSEVYPGKNKARVVSLYIIIFTIINIIGLILYFNVADKLRIDDPIRATMTGVGATIGLVLYYRSVSKNHNY